MSCERRRAWLIGGLICVVCTAMAVLMVSLRRGCETGVTELSPAESPKGSSVQQAKSRKTLAATASKPVNTESGRAGWRPEGQERVGARSMKSTRLAVETRGQRPPFVRAEDRGEDFSLLPTGEVVRRLVTTTERVVRQKAGRVLGDRHLAGTLTLEDRERDALAAYVARQVQLTAAPVGEDRTDANDQIQRLWRLATSGVIDGLAEKNLAIVEAAMRNLAVMRNQDIVATLIRRIEGGQDTVFRAHAVVALGMMREKRDCLVPGRHTLGDEESEAIGTNVITPFLTRLETAEQDPQVRQAIKMAFELLRNPHDARPKPVGSPLPAQTRPAEGQ